MNSCKIKCETSYERKKNVKPRKDETSKPENLPFL